MRSYFFQLVLWVFSFSFFHFSHVSIFLLCCYKRAALLLSLRILVLNVRCDTKVHFTIGINKNIDAMGVISTCRTCGMMWRENRHGMLDVMMRCPEIEIDPCNCRNHQPAHNQMEQTNCLMSIQGSIINITMTSSVESITQPPLLPPPPKSLLLRQAYFPALSIYVYVSPRSNKVIKYGGYRTVQVKTLIKSW